MGDVGKFMGVLIELLFVKIYLLVVFDDVMIGCDDV